jgi:hypothetical protein
MSDFQNRVAPWMQECFGPEISADRVERGDRLLEETLELLQSGGYDKERVAELVNYVWGRPAGEPAQEVGGVMVTLAAYCLAHALDMQEAGEVELARILQPAIVARIRAKQAAKARDIPFSPLPSADASGWLNPSKSTPPENAIGVAVLCELTCCIPGGLMVNCFGRDKGEWIVPPQVQHRFKIIGWAPLPPMPATHQPKKH